MTDRTAAAVVQSTLDAFAAGDRGAIGRLLGRDYFTHRPGPAAASAAEVVGPLIGDVLAAYPDMTIRLLELEQDGDEVARGRVALAGTNTGGIWGVPPTGRPFGLELGFRLRRVAGGHALNLDGLEPPAIMGFFREVELVNPADQMHLPPRHRNYQMPEFLLRLAWNGQVADKPCGHLDQVRFTRPSGTRCEECPPDALYPTIRLCLICGHLGCCDTSTEKHARAHFQATGHPLMRSLHNLERWMWCYEDGVLVGGDTLDRLAAELGA